MADEKKATKKVEQEPAQTAGPAPTLTQGIDELRQASEEAVKSSKKKGS